MTQVGNATASTTHHDSKPLTPSQDEMRAELEKLMQQAVKNAESIDPKSLVKRATIGTPDENLFS